jgi:hypothetical protein
LLFAALIFTLCIHVAIVIFSVEAALVFLAFGVVVGVVSVIVIFLIVPLRLSIIPIVFVNIVLVFLVVILPIGIVFPAWCLLRVGDFLLWLSFAPFTTAVSPSFHSKQNLAFSLLLLADFAHVE